MKKAAFKLTKSIKAIFFGLVFVQIFALAAFAQNKTPATKSTPAADLPKVTQIDEAGLKNAIKPNGKPLLVNFWATWCDPCREEFPDLVKLDTEYKSKIDFITISLDDLAEIKRDVPKFLADMKAEMPAYLLKVPDEGAAIAMVTKDWQGGLPFTILYNEKGEIAFFKQGKVKIDALKIEIDKLTSEPIKTTAFEEGKTDAQKDSVSGILKFKTNNLNRRHRMIQQRLKENYEITVESSQNPLKNSTFSEMIEYFKGYNSISEIEIAKKFGDSVVKAIKDNFTPFSEANVVELTLTTDQKP